MGTRAGPDSSVEFVAFWAAYPRKCAKGAAKKAWVKAVKLEDPWAIIEAARRYRDDPNRVATFTAHPSTWLNQERWDDEPLPPRLGNRDSQSAGALLEWVGDGRAPGRSGAIDAVSRGIPRGDQ